MRKSMKRVVSVSVSCLIASGLLLGSVEYASHTFAAAKAAAGAVTVAAQEISNRVEQKRKISGITKEESVYATLDASGKKKEVIVSDWLKGSGINGALEDVSNLENIQNTKGDETFTQNGEAMTWDAKEQDIYYQGTTQEELPVGMEITYTLDGKEIAPEELAGKSGALKICIQYQNTSVSTMETEDGTKKEVYTPFLMATGMILPVEKFSNVQIDHGQILSEGDNDIVVAYGMPGLKESLDLDGIDFGDEVSLDADKIEEKITDSVTITADVTDFEMGASYTMATSSLFSDMDFGSLSEGEDLDNKIEELKDAAVQLVDGSDQIQDGLQELDDSFAAYEKAIHKLKDSVKQIKDGSKKIHKATKKYTKSTDKLLGAVNTYVDGAKEFAKSTKTYSSGTKQLVDGVGALYSAASGFPKSYGDFHASLDAYTTGVNTLLSADNMDQMTNGTAALKKGVEDVDAGLKQIQSGVSDIHSNAQALHQQEENAGQCITALQTMKEQYDALAEAETDASVKAQYKKLSEAAEGAISYMQAAEKLAAGIDTATNGKSDGEADGNGQKDLAAGLAQVEAATDPTAKEENLYTGIHQLDQSAKAIAENAKTLRSKKTALMEASNQIKSSISQISSNLNLLYKNGKLITANNKKLSDAADVLSSNSGKVKKNSKKLTASSGDFRKATSTLASGSVKLYQGVKTLTGKTGQVSDGIEQLADGAVDLYDGMTEFKEEGVDKLTATVTDLLEGGSALKDTVESLQTAAEDYKSFSGISENMDGRVKFILTTEEIQKEAE